MAGGKKGDKKPVRTGTLPPQNSNSNKVTSGDVLEVWLNKKITPIDPGNNRVSNSVRPYKIRSVLGHYLYVCLC